MYKQLSIMIPLYLVSIGIFAMDIDKNEIEKEVRDAFEKLVDSARSLNHENYISQFDENNFTALNENGTVTDDFQSFSNMTKTQFSALKRYHALDFNNIKISVLSEDVVILINEFSATVELQSGQIVEGAGGGTQVWHKVDGTWKLANVSGSPQQ